MTVHAASGDPFPSAPSLISLPSSSSPGVDPPAPTLRFAFYGRVSTEDQQDPESSRGWQLTRANALIGPRGGQIVEEFFDIGDSRSMPWQRRPQANRLLTALRDPQRGFEAVVIGEPHRAFYGNQFGLTLPLFVHFGVQLWVPEIGGAIDASNEAHELVMSVFGGMSKGERNRIKVRVRTAMAAQTHLEGRFLGGRPPYGYALADLGRHPNPGKAAEGRRLHGLTPDPVTAPVVQRIFAEYLAGAGLFLIAEGLTEDGILCPSAYDPDRNPHRSGIAWSKSAVRAILTNPRYTGRQVWNRQRKDEVLLDIDDVAKGHTAVTRWNERQAWTVSKDQAHEALIDEETFVRVQETLQARAVRKGPHARHRTRHVYVFRGVVFCALCRRRMQAQTQRDTAYYRCRLPAEYALPAEVVHPRNVYFREDAVIGRIDAWLASVFSVEQREQTLNTLAATILDQEPAPAAVRAQQLIVECEAKLARYKAALEAGADPEVVSGWIRAAQAQRTQAQDALSRYRLTDTPGVPGLSREQIEAVLDQAGGAVALLRGADPAEKAQVYRQLGVELTYDPQTHTVGVQASLDHLPWAYGPCPRGDLNPHAPEGTSTSS